MVYILKNLNLRKFFISFMICFIFIIIGITHVFADEKENDSIKEKSESVTVESTEEIIPEDTEQSEDTEETETIEETEVAENTETVEEGTEIEK